MRLHLDKGLSRSFSEGSAAGEAPMPTTRAGKAVLRV